MDIDNCHGMSYMQLVMAMLAIQTGLPAGARDRLNTSDQTKL
jgi:hypothetical protein